MSPSESQLRAALHDGEGDSPDVNSVISHALRVRRDRRKRINAIAGGAVAAALVGLGVSGLAGLTRNGGDSASTADKAAGGGAAAVAGGAVRAPVATRSGAITPFSADGATAYAAVLPCPVRPDRLLLPGGGGSGQFGSSGRLFTGGVAALRVCAYPLRASAKTRSVVVSGPEASALAASLEAAPVTRASSSCPANTDYVGGTIEILGVGARLSAVKPVVITLGCLTSQATNGTAVRYLTNLPESLLALLSTTPTKSTSNPSPGQDQSSSPP